MNYIKQLQQDNERLNSQMDQALTAITEFRTFLNSSKFNGIDLDGERKDWISTSDVQAQLFNIGTILS